MVSNENRKFMRFVAPLKVEIEGRLFGLVKDISRFGFRIVCEKFDYEPDASVDFRLEKPGKNVFVLGSGRVMWKRFTDGRWDAGIQFTKFPVFAKADILEYAYTKWVNERTCSFRGNLLV